MSMLVDTVVAYVEAQTRQNCKGPAHSWSVNVDAMGAALDVDHGALQTAIRKAWAAGRLHIDVLRDDDCAYAVTLGERTP